MLHHEFFNVDETGISTVQKPPPIIGCKGQKQVGSATSLERGRNITVCCAMSASGIFIPPMFIFPGVNATEKLKRGGPAGSISAMAKSGWMNEDLFLQWLKHFVHNTQSSVENPTLLLLDNHSSHTSLACYNFCKENCIIVISFPPHTSHCLQPLDLTVFGPLKTAYNKECSLFFKTHGFTKIYKEDVLGLFKAAYEKIACISKAVSGFTKPGIFPMNPDVFTEDDFLPANTGLIPVNESNAEVEDRPCCTSALPLAGEISQRDLEQTAGDSQTPIPVSQISPIPERPPPSSSRGRPKQHSEILTATPRKLLLQNTEKKRKRKLASCEAKDLRKKRNFPSRKRKRTVKKLIFEESSSSDEGVNQHMCDDDDVYDVNLEESVKNITENTDKNNLCLFCEEFGRDGELWFRCVMCSGWVHAACSAAETASAFICDYCTAKS